VDKSIKIARAKCLKKFLYYFKKGFADKKYIAWEREYKYNAYKTFHEELDQAMFKKLLQEKKYEPIAQTVVKIESRTNLLFSFEKMALRDALKIAGAIKDFSIGLYNYIYGADTLQQRFEDFVKVVEALPRKQTRVLTWPIVTVFGFIANPNEHIFLKPRVTQIAAEKYKFDLGYTSKPNWNTYKQVLLFADQIKKDTVAYKPHDYIDLQSFIWVLGSEEYPD
jgi:hypothetical protein